MSNTVATNFVRPAAPAYASSPSLYGRDGRRKYLNLAERQRVLAAMSALEKDKALFALTLAWSGARVSEVLALNAASFQIESGIAAVNTLKRRKRVIREVPLPATLMQALDERFALRASQLDSVAALQRLWPWCRATAWRLIKVVMREAGVVGLPACPHGLRHSFGVGTLQAGVPLNLVQRWMGHSRLSSTAIYLDACGPEERAFASGFWTTGVS